jgi:hypothetical protein
MRAEDIKISGTKVPWDKTDLWVLFARLSCPRSSKKSNNIGRISEIKQQEIIR